MTVIREGYSEEMLKVVFEHVASGSCTTCCDTCSNYSSCKIRYEIIV